LLAFESAAQETKSLRVAFREASLALESGGSKLPHSKMT
jgi:hypothetical protein